MITNKYNSEVLKSFDMISQYLEPSITKKVMLYSCFTLPKGALTALQMQNFQESISIYLKIIKNFLI